MKPHVNLAQLRQRAEQAIASAGKGNADRRWSSLDVLGLVEELRIYQTELEIQNQELVASQAQASEALDKYQSLFENLPLPVLLVDARGFIVESNYLAQVWLNLSGAQLRQSYSVLQFIDAAKRYELQAVLADRRRDEPALLPQALVRLSGRSEVPCDLHVIHQPATEEADPAAARSQVVFVDKSLEVELGHKSIDLARAMESAQAASVAKSSFLAKMSHELRTPMSIILGAAELLERREALAPSPLEKVVMIRDAGERLLAIVNDILDLSRVESGKFSLDNHPFVLQELLDRLAGEMKPLIEKKGLKFRIELGLGLPQQLIGDPLRIEQALMNYLGNALKFTEKGEIGLTVALEDVSEAAAQRSVTLRFSVSDSGIGIDPVDAARLFQPFEQVDNSNTRRFGGTGLGLTITRQLAQMMGGQAGFDSRPGSGSRFWFTARFALPEAAGDSAAARMLAGTADANTDTNTNPPAPEALLQQHCRGRRVLLCEDELIIQAIVGEYLESVGCEVHYAENGQAGVAMARAESFDVILMDMQMPLMNGIDATRAIRQLPGYATVPVVALTANAFKEDQEACLAAGMNAFLSKPLDVNALYRLMWQLLSEAT